MDQPERTIKFDRTHIMDRDTSRDGGRITLGINGVASESHEDKILVDPAHSPLVDNIRQSSCISTMSGDEAR